MHSDEIVQKLQSLHGKLDLQSDLCQSRWLGMEEEMRKLKDSDASKNRLAKKITSIVGLQEAATSKHVGARLTWILLVLMGIGATTFFLYQTTDEYIRNPTATSIELEKDSDLRFTPMVICPKVWFDVEKSDAAGLTRDALRYSLSFIDADMRDIKNVSKARAEFLDFFDDPSSFSQNTSKFIDEGIPRPPANGFRSLFEYLRWLAIDLDNGPEAEGRRKFAECTGCTDSNPTKTALDGRMCYEFDFRPIEKGLGMYATDHRYIYVVFRPRSMGIMGRLGEADDWYLYFNPYPNQFPINTKMSIQAGYINEANYNVQKFRALNKPKDPCRTEENYTSVSCMLECHNRMYLDYFNCYLFRLTTRDSDLDPRQICNYADTFVPLKKTMWDSLHTKENERIEMRAAEICQKECPLECERSIVETTVYRHGMMWWVVENPNVTFLLVDVKHGGSYSRGIVVMREVSTYSLVQWVSNLGGSLGLFVGSTVMTFAQMVMYSVEWCLSRGRRSG